MEIKVFPELTFESSDHTYHLDGLMVPSVTTLMKPLSSAYYHGINTAVLDNAAKRGTAVHAAIDTYVQFGITDVEPEFEGYFNAFLSWMRDFDVKPYATESRTYHKTLRYAGTVDMSCAENGIDTLVDFKTTSSFSAMLCGVQLEAYIRAQESHDIRYENRAVIHLRSDGTYQRRTDFPPSLECWKVFASLLNVSGFIEKYR